MSPRRSPARRFAVREGKVLRVAVGVMLNLIISTYAFYSIVLLRVTPTANRNSYRVARLVGSLPRVAVFARNPGLGNRNSYRVVKDKPHPNLPQGEGVPPKVHPNHYKPHPNLSQGEKTSSNRLKHSRNKIHPLGEDWGGAAALGRGFGIDTKKGQTVSHY